LTKDPIYSARSKHIEARYFFIRELAHADRVRPTYIASRDNLADIFTKPLTQEAHYRFMPFLGLFP